MSQILHLSNTTVTFQTFSKMSSSYDDYPFEEEENVSFNKFTLSYFSRILDNKIRYVLEGRENPVAFSRITSEMVSFTWRHGDRTLQIVLDGFSPKMEVTASGDETRINYFYDFPLIHSLWKDNQDYTDLY